MTKNMIPCPSCKVNTIDDSRNKRRKCKHCADLDIKAKKRHKQVARLSFEDGCKKALHDNSNGAVTASALLNCHPIKIQIKKKNKDQKDITTHALMHTEEVKNISKQLEIGFGDSSSTFQAELQLSEQVIEINYSCKKCDVQANRISSEDMAQIVTSSNLPNLLKYLGPYVEVDNEMLELLNTDFRMNQRSLSLIPILFAGALIHDQVSLMVITAEVYSRHASIDVHLETGVDSLPSSKCLYEGLSCSIIVSSDGNNISKKLIIGSSTMNILITCSSTITSSRLHEVFVGPQVDLSPTSFSVESAKIFLRLKQVAAFKKAFDLSSDFTHRQSSNISCLRQLSSSFDHVSTYAYLRATLSDFNDTKFMPVTVFTLCDTPDYDGYGSSRNSIAKIGSLLLQTIAINLNLEQLLSKENMQLFNTAYEATKDHQENESWKVIDNVVTQINSLTENNKDVSKLILQVNLSKVATLVGGQLHKANQKIAANVKSRLLNLYG